MKWVVLCFRDRFSKMQLMRFWSLLITFFFFLEVSGTRPVAINGVLDLRDYNLNEDKPILLKGEWEFHWNELKEPGSFVNGVSGIPIINVPTAWTNKVLPDGTQLPGTGFATYRLRVLLAKK